MPDLLLAFTLYKNVIFWDVEISTFLPGIFLTFFCNTVDSLPESPGYTKHPFYRGILRANAIFRLRKRVV